MRDFLSWRTVLGWGGFVAAAAVGFGPVGATAIGLVYAFSGDALGGAAGKFLGDDEGAGDAGPLLSAAHHAMQNLMEGLLGGDRQSTDFAQHMADLFLPAGNYSSPIIVDLDGDGVELTAENGAQPVYFDLGNADGFAESTGWVSADDGILALDINGDGRISSGAELFGDQTGHENGFEALRAYDVDGSGVIDAGDAIWNKLTIWRDADQDAQTDAGELHTMADLGIVTSSGIAGLQAM